MHLFMYTFRTLTNCLKISYMIVQTVFYAQNESLKQLYHICMLIQMSTSIIIIWSNIWHISCLFLALPQRTQICRRVPGQKAGSQQIDDEIVYVRRRWTDSRDEQYTFSAGCQERHVLRSWQCVEFYFVVQVRNAIGIKNKKYMFLVYKVIFFISLNFNEQREITKYCLIKYNLIAKSVILGTYLVMEVIFNIQNKNFNCFTSS